MRSYENENVAEHSHCVAIMAHALCVIENNLFGGSLDENKAAVIALYHETSEVITGDLPTPINISTMASPTLTNSSKVRRRKKCCDSCLTSLLTALRR